MLANISRKIWNEFYQEAVSVGIENEDKIGVYILCHLISSGACFEESWETLNDKWNVSKLKNF